MIIYYALTTYHIQCCVLHKLTFHNDENCILLLSNIHTNSITNVEQYRQSGIFSDIYVIDEASVNKYIRSVDLKHHKKETIWKKVINQMEKVIPVQVKEASIRYLCPDHFPFGWYVIGKKLPYVCFEEGCGVLSDTRLLLSNLKNNPVQFEMMDYIGYFGNNPYASKILADTKAQHQDYRNDRMEDFSVKRILEQMNDDKRGQVLSFFGVKDISLPQHKMGLLLTQHMANLKIMSLEKQHLLYQLLADYFLDSLSLVIKPHPDDLAGQYNRIFQGTATVLPFYMPSELLPYCLKGVYQVAVAASSTSVKSLGANAERTICFDTRIHQDINYIHRYYAAVRVLQHLGFTEIETNANELLIQELNQTLKVGPLDALDKGVLVISDKGMSIQDIQQRMKQNRTMILFLNEEGRHLYFDGMQCDVFKALRPVVIEFSNGKKEVIYVYSENQEILNQIGILHEKKRLKYTDVEIDISGISVEERRKIAVLEGILEATEKRLREYIKEGEAYEAAGTTLTI